MSNTTQSSPYSEDWSSYRKLVVDTLKRLDDRTLDIFQRLSDLTSRVNLIEHAGHDKEIARIEKLVDAVDQRVDDVETIMIELKTKLAGADGAKAVYMWLVGIGCSVVGFLASIAVEKLLP
jgi:hypothetical protein